MQLLSHLAPLFGLLSFACEVSNQINIEKKELGLKKELGILNLSFSIDNCKNLLTTYVGFGFSILVHKQQSIVWSLTVICHKPELCRFKFQHITANTNQ